MAQLNLTTNAIAKITQAQQTGSQVLLKSFALSNNNNDDQVTDEVLFSADISNVTVDSQNAHTLIITCVLPSGEAIEDTIRKCFIYDENDDLFAYGLINQFDYSSASDLEAEIKIYLTFGGASSVTLITNDSASVSLEVFNAHQHDERYHLKTYLDPLLATYALQDHNHDDRYVLKPELCCESTNIDYSNSPLDSITTNYFHTDSLPTGNLERTTQMSSSSFASSITGVPILAKNGLIYFFGETGKVYKFNPNNNTTTEINVGVSNYAGYSYHLTPNNKIYSTPSGTTGNICVFDIASETMTLITSRGSSLGQQEYYGGILHPNGKIYCPPGAKGTSILVIDTSNDTISTIGSFPQTSLAKWYGATVAGNGKIYCTPFSNSSVLVIDPSNNTTTTFGNFAGTNKWRDGVLTAENKIYTSLYDAVTPLVIDTTNDTAVISSLAVQSTKLLPNGLLYGTQGTTAIAFDPVTEQIMASAPDISIRGAIAPNGKTYYATGGNMIISDPGSNVGTCGAACWAISPFYTR